LCHADGYNADDAVGYDYSAKLSGDSHFGGGYRQLQLHNHKTQRAHPQQSKDKKAF
jgi:hypothetical protein